SVDINIMEDAAKVYIEIKDSGIGISEKALPHIFDEFRQVDGSTSRQYQGTGLGLTIANKLIRILGGSIQVESKIGIGSTFTVCIPMHWDHVNDHNINRLAIPVATKQTKPNLKTILVVDDDPEIVRNISSYLIQSGYRTITTTSGREALRLAIEHQPFAITLDVMMPDMDGWEVLQELKSHAQIKNIPVIIVSVSDDRDTGFALGAVGYINKPINRILLVSEIYKLMKSPETIMIVDDDDFERKQISSIIDAEKLKTIPLSGGLECLQMMEKNIPDILILDLMMPEMNGFQVLEKIRKDEKTKDLPIIVVTAKDLTSDDKKVLSGNISSIITKSEVSQQDILVEINRIIKDLEKSKIINLPVKKSNETRILIVEDNTEAILQVKSVLEKENYIVDIANGGQEALDYLKSTIPDGIILDLMMPNMDGFEFLKIIRADERTKNTAVLVLTAKDLTQADMQKLNSNDVQQIIYKGDIDIRGLISKVNIMLTQDTIINIDHINFNLPKNIAIKKNKKHENSLAQVLIIEDHPDNMTSIKAILHGQYEIFEAIDGEQGLAKIQSLLPDLILLDISLPKISGEEILEIIKADNKTKDIPVIVVTAMAMKGDQERFIKAGSSGYISKPIDGEKLLNEIRKHV
ncbi:MAG: response regulator, partial [Bacteroidales bacterium]|nr:response regulator [Bacteroidales bacterium]